MLIKNQKATVKGETQLRDVYGHNNSFWILSDESSSLTASELKEGLKPPHSLWKFSRNKPASLFPKKNVEIVYEDNTIVSGSHVLTFLVENPFLVVETTHETRKNRLRFNSEGGLFEWYSHTKYEFQPLKGLAGVLEDEWKVFDIQNEVSVRKEGQNGQDESLLFYIEFSQAVLSEVKEARRNFNKNFLDYSRRTSQAVQVCTKNLNKLIENKLKENDLKGRLLYGPTQSPSLKQRIVVNPTENDDYVEGTVCLYEVEKEDWNSQKLGKVLAKFVYKINMF